MNVIIVNCQYYIDLNERVKCTHYFIVTIYIYIHNMLKKLK